MIHLDIKALTSLKRLGVPEDLDVVEVNRLCCLMDEFVNTLPSKTYELTKIFSVRDFSYLARRLHEIGTFLDSIYAVKLADQCSDLIANLVNKEKYQLDGQMQKFLTELMTLSIDVQTANYNPHPEVIHQPAKSALKQADGAKKTILAVDDVPLLLKTLKSMIEDERFIFHGLNSGAGALNYLQKHEPDLFILDIEMPGMDGYELFKKIREMGHVAPIIFLTGNATRECVISAMKLGADGFLAKPVEKYLVREKLEEFLG